MYQCVALLACVPPCVPARPPARLPLHRRYWIIHLSLVRTSKLSTRWEKGRQRQGEGEEWRWEGGGGGEGKQRCVVNNGEKVKAGGGRWLNDSSQRLPVMADVLRVRPSARSLCVCVRASVRVGVCVGVFRRLTLHQKNPGSHASFMLSVTFTVSSSLVMPSLVAAKGTMHLLQYGNGILIKKVCCLRERARR